MAVVPGGLSRVSAAATLAPKFRKMPEIDYETEINEATWLYADQRDPERAKENLSDAARIVRAILAH